MFSNLLLTLLACAFSYKPDDNDGDGLSPDLDCNDNDPKISAPSVDAYVDEDGDGYGAGAAQKICEITTGYASRDGDCDDISSTVYPGAPEKCNGLDDDCNDSIDDNPVDPSTYYTDADGDGYGDPDTAVSVCPDNATSLVDNGDDCLDTDETVHPGATEACNGIDDNCDGTIDEGTGTYVYYQDRDNDGYGNPLVTITGCTAPAGYVDSDEDCNDRDRTVHPGATESCDGIDEDCDTWDGTATHGEYLAAGGMYMTCLNAGTFTMGSPEGEIGRDINSQSVETEHTVELTNDFLISIYLVTQYQYETFEGVNPSTNVGADYPVETLTWSQATDFANQVSVAEGLAECYTCTGAWEDLSCELDTSLASNPYDCEGYRLLTEAEYEYAARSEGAVTDAFPNGGNLISDADTANCAGSLVLDNGTQLDSVAWYCGNASDVTHPVGQLLPNASGLYDMVGNLGVFINDWWDSTYYSISPTTDPTGPTNGSSYVGRGGGFASDPEGTRISYRRYIGPTDASRGFGLRLARTY